MEIRSMQSGDMQQVLTLYRELMPNGAYYANAEAYFARVQQQPDTHLLVAVENGQVLGTALGLVCQGMAERFLVVEDVVVLESMRGKGVGTQLFARLDEIALASGCTYAILVSSAFRRQAHAFYRKVGYVDEVAGFRKVYEPFH